MSIGKMTQEQIENFNKALDNLKPMTKEQRYRMMQENFARGSREEPDNLLLDDELTGPDEQME